MSVRRLVLDRRWVLAASGVLLLLSPARGGSASSAQEGGATAYEKSLSLVDEVLARHPRNAQLLVIRARVQFRRGKFTEAAAGFEEAMKRDPSLLEPVLGLGNCQRRLKNHLQAIEAFKKVIAGGPSPQAAQAARQLAETYMDLGQLAEAIERLRTSIGLGDSGAEMCFLLGQALEAHARALAAGSAAEKARSTALATEAVEWLERAVRANPQHAPSYYLLRGIHQRLGRPDLAAQDLASYRRAKSSPHVYDDPDFQEAESLFEARTALELARAVHPLGDAQVAESLVAHALKVKPDFVDARAYQAWMLYQQGNVDGAAEVFESILKEQPAHGESLWSLGRLYLAAGRTEEAAPLLLRAAEVRKDSPEVWELLAKLAAEHGVYPEREEEFLRSAVRTRPSPANFTALAWFLFKARKTAEAGQVIDEGLKRYPQDPALRGARDSLGAAKGAGR